MGLITILMTILVCGSQATSYILVAIRNPGVANVIDNDSGDQQPGRRSAGQIWYFPILFRFCDVCKLRQLPTTVHCGDCKICILDMDHHCPWTGKCIGRGNIKEFYGFLVCTLVYMVFNIIVTMTSAMPLLIKIEKKP